jgi:hypothetical protein
MSIESLIAEKIQKLDPTLNVKGSDRKMIQLVCKDFANYMKFSQKSAYKFSFTEKEKYSKIDLPELKSFLTIWTGKWMEKWRERVKLRVGPQSKEELTENNTTVAKAQPVWENLKFKEELIDIVMSELITNGEICGTASIAEYVVKTNLTNNCLELDAEKTINFLSTVIHRAHEISKTNGPLMFLEINKNYYNSI